MKRSLFQLILIILIFSMCETVEKNSFKKIFLLENANVEIVIDTLDVKIGGEIEKAVCHQNKFIAIFKGSKFKAKAKFNGKKLYIFGENGDIINEIDLPWKVKRLRLYDLKIFDNHLYFLRKDGLNNADYRMSLIDFSFHEVEQEKYALYEDDEYQVFGSCYGEWGGTVFFKNKKSKKIYEATSTCPVKVNKIGKEYFLTNYMAHISGTTSVLKISDPKKLKLIEEKDPFNRSLEKHVGNYNNQGVEVVLDTFDLKIQDSFIIHDRLKHLYVDEEGTHIGESVNGKLSSLYKFDFKFYPMYAYQDPKDRKIITFVSEKGRGNGILVIENNKLNFYFIK